VRHGKDVLGPTFPELSSGWKDVGSLFREGEKMSDHTKCAQSVSARNKVSVSPLCTDTPRGHATKNRP